MTGLPSKHRSQPAKEWEQNDRATRAREPEGHNGGWPDKRVINICTFKWGDKYTTEHVARLRDMLARNLTIPYRFTVISDDPDDADIPRVHWVDLRTPTWDKMRAAKLCGIRLRAFGSDMRDVLGPRFAWVDLDVVIVDNVDHLFSRKEPFVGLATPQGPLWYNGSLIMMDAGARPEVERTWTPVEYARLPDYYAKRGMRWGGQSDEGWMSYVLGDKEARITREDGAVYMKHLVASVAADADIPLPKGTCLVVMNGRKFDPTHLSWQMRCPWLREHWRLTGGQ